MRKWRLLIAIPAVVVLLAVGGTWLYINVIRADPAPELTLEADDSGTTAPSGEAGPIAGTWMASTGSEAGYRVKEVLFGQSTTGVGRTTAVTGSLVIEGTTVEKADFEVDMTTVTSDQSRRDGQFHGRIMETSTFPTATFTLTKSIDIGEEPALGAKVQREATGDLTLHGVKRAVTFPLEAVHSTDGIQVAGSIPIVFADYDIENPSNMAASTEDNGTLEFRLELVPA